MLARLAGGARLLTLTGPGGSGKTRLAIEAAAALVPDLRGRRLLGRPRHAPRSRRSSPRRSRAARRDGRPRRAHRRARAARAPRQLRAGHRRGARALRPPRGLPEPHARRHEPRAPARAGRGRVRRPSARRADAVALFCDRARVEPSDEIAELCGRLDSLPLAVELAAARTKALSPAQILERLWQRLDLLTGRPRRRPAPADAPGDDRVVVRPALGRRAAALPPLSRSSPAAARSRRPSSRRRRPRHAAVARREEPPPLLGTSATGCSRRSASSRPSGSTAGERTRCGAAPRLRRRARGGERPEAATPPTRAPSRRGSTPTTRTCARPCRTRSRPASRTTSDASSARSIRSSSRTGIWPRCWQWAEAALPTATGSRARPRRDARRRRRDRAVRRRPRPRRSS